MAVTSSTPAIVNLRRAAGVWVMAVIVEHRSLMHAAACRDRPERLDHVQPDKWSLPATTWSDIVLGAGLAEEAGRSERAAIGGCGAQRS
jgi:hypothetical protein